MLEYVVRQTAAYMESMPKQIRKKSGQFFTSIETARFMAGLFAIPAQPEITILDPGAGTGILTAALLERISAIPSVERVHLICYETDEKIIPVLEDNLRYVTAHCLKKADYELRTLNYITSQENAFNGGLFPESGVTCDLCIGNPPYMKIGKDAPEAKSMPAICYGAPNLYFLFAAMSLFNVCDSGEMVYIIPRSWTSGMYFKRFRQYLFSHGVIEQIHLFTSRDKVFDTEQVLQETMIVKIRKQRQVPSDILVTSSESNCDFRHLQQISLPYSAVVSGADQYVFLMTNHREVDAICLLNTFPYTLPDFGMKMKTGLTVDFRERESLRNTEVDGAVPLFFAQHIQNGHICFPIGKEGEYLVPSRKSLVQPNTNYLFIRRFTAKEEKRRLQCGIYLAEQFPQYQTISTQNKINFIDNADHTLSKDVVYGLYVLFNSTLYDVYYRVLNGSTQVNATEINHMPVPAISIIEELGRALLKQSDITEKTCNQILEGFLHGKNQRSSSHS
ncbi:Eco57I restriction-modification methylase domain-containing protein [uncultured Megasphaera sp.]|uniref:Eco57I restriction-modification methylase domain-containing protein n=1 Tax=Megasphaera sp. TaxID=2023260 RepID=UPI0026DD5DAF|nr:Eco57I restriction-modification methylase domain-containing protein [uncultured Megasphaera sp.]